MILQSSTRPLYTRDDPQQGDASARADARATIAALPDAFDWRTQPLASKCPSIGTVRDQAGCGSCWAFGTAEAMSDRLCIASKGQVSVELSAQNIASCACAGGCKGGCGGGQLGQAWDYYLHTGVVDGGLYGDNTTCDPYTIPSCAHHTSDPKLKNCTVRHFC